MDRRQPADPSRHDPHPYARLGADASRFPRPWCARSNGSQANEFAWREGVAHVTAPAISEEWARVSVIFSRAPLRISLGGGGTDLPSYYREHGGFLVSGAIDKYVYMLTHTVFQRRYRMKYSEIEEVDEISRDPPSDPAREPAAPLARKPTRDRLGRRCAGRHRYGLIGRVHGLPAQGPRARAQHLDHPRAARRGRVRDRDRRPRRARRQAGPLRRRPRRDLRIHVSPRRHGGCGAARAGARRRCGACAINCCSSTPARRARPRTFSPTRTSAPRPATRDDREPAPHQGDRSREPASCSRRATSRAMPN